MVQKCSMFSVREAPGANEVTHLRVHAGQVSGKGVNSNQRFEFHINTKFIPMYFLSG